jgi:ubiquinone/menaquinone biosynthesis C-methylase UbiE
MSISQHAHHHAADPEQYAVQLERMNRFQERQARTAIAALHLPAGSRGLDVGCGVGLYTLWLAEAIGAGGQVSGIDRADERIASARRLVGQAPAAERITFKPGDGTALGEDDRSFDWVWCADVLHHIDDPVLALTEFVRVVRPGGMIVIKESQVFNALFLPGYPELERQLQRAELQFQHSEAGAQSFQERRQHTRTSMMQAGLQDVQVRTYVVEHQAPLPPTARAYIQHGVFERNWGERIRGFLDAKDWQQRSALCKADAPQAILDRPDYYCVYPFTMFTARRAV